MSPKNVECVRVVLSLALTEGDHLAESWFMVSSGWHGALPARNADTLAHFNKGSER